MTGILQNNVVPQVPVITNDPIVMAKALVYALLPLHKRQLSSWGELDNGVKTSNYCRNPHSDNIPTIYTMRILNIAIH